VQIVLGDVGHEVLRAVRGAEDDCSRLPKARHNRRVFAGDAALVRQAADLATMAGGRDRGLHRYWKSGEGALGFLGRSRLLADSLRVEIDQGVDLRVQALNLADVLVRQFECGNLPGLQENQQIEG